MKTKIIAGLLFAGVMMGQSAFAQTDTSRKNRNPKDTSWNKKNPQDTNWQRNKKDTFSRNPTDTMWQQKKKDTMDLRSSFLFKYEAVERKQNFTTK